MELRDYLRVIRHRFWILVLVPALAGVAVFWSLRDDPPHYAAVATVAAPALVGAPTSQYSGANGTRSFVSNFVAVAGSQRIRDRAAASTGIDPGRIRGQIVAKPVGDSSVMQVRYETLSRDEAAPIARAVAAETIRFLFETQLILAQKSAEEGKKAVEEADLAIAEFTAQAGVAIPDLEYEIKARQVSTLQQKVVEAQAAGDSAGAGRYSQELKTKQTELTDLAPKVAGYLALKDRKNQVMTQHTALLQNLQNATGQFEAANPDLVVTIGGTRKVPRAQQMIQGIGTAVGAALFLATLLVVVLEVLSKASSADPRLTQREIQSPPAIDRDPDLGAGPVPARSSVATAGVPAGGAQQARAEDLPAPQVISIDWRR